MTTRHPAQLLALGLPFLIASAVSADVPPCDYVCAVASDYGVSGAVSTIDVLPPWSSDIGLESVHSDAVARYHDGLVYVVNRLYGDNIQVLDPHDGFATVGQFSVGPGSGPTDIAFVSSSRAYVSRYESRWLYEVDPTAGAVTDSIDLGGFSDGDGLPEMDTMVIVDGRLFVAIQRIDRDYYWLPDPPSWLAVVDVGTNTLVDVDPGTLGVQGIELTGTNPYADLLVGDDGLIYVGESGSWGSADGGIEAVDPATMSALGFVTTESQLGGDILDFTMPTGGRAFAALTVSAPDWESFCVSFDWSSGAVIGTVWRPGGYVVDDIELHAGAGELFLADRSYTNHGVRVFDAADDSQLTTSPIFFGLPPDDLLVVGGDVVGVPEPADVAALRLAVRENPSVGTAVLEIEGGSRGPVEVTVYDIAGRVVRRLPGETSGRGPVEVSWDGRDASGRRAGSGVYCVRATCGDASGRTVLVLLH